MPDLSQVAQDIHRTGLGRLSLSEPMVSHLEELVDRATLFFSLPEAAKNRCRLPEECGYRAIGEEYSATPDHPDLVQSFSFNSRAAVSSSLISEGTSMWNSMSLVFADMTGIAQEVFSSLSLLYGVDRKLPPSNPFEGWSRLQINFSQPSLHGSQPIHDCHEDGDFFTIATATARGLEIQGASGMVEGPTSLDEVVIMPGEILSLMTGGDVRPAYHAVNPKPGVHQRIAVMLFADIAPTFCDAWHKTSANQDVNIAERVRRSVERFGLRGFDSTTDSAI